MNDLSGYGEIKIGENTLPFKFGTNAYRLLCQHRGVELHQLGEVFSDPFALIELAYFAYVTAVRMAGSVTTYGLDSFVEIVGDNADIIPEFEKLITTSKMWGVAVGDTKKKT